MKKDNSVSKSVVSVTFVIFLGKFLGFVKQIVVAGWFGTSIETDMISISEGFVSNLEYLIVQSLLTSFIPIYIHIKDEGKNEEGRFAKDTIIVFLFISMALSLVIFMGAPIISRMLAPTYSVENSRVLAGYFRFLAPTLIMLVLISIYNAILKSNESFVLSELMGVNQSVTILVFVLLFGNVLGPNILLYSYVIYVLCTGIFLGLCSKKYWLLKPKGGRLDSSVVNLLKMMGPLIVGYSIVFVNQQIDKMIVSSLGNGTITAMGYAAVLSNFICTFIASISGVLFVYVTQSIANKNHMEAASFLVENSLRMITLVLPICILTVTNSYDIISIVFGRGEFGPSAIDTCSQALVGYGMMFVPFVIRELFSRFQYGYGDTKRPMINSTIGIIVNIFMSIILSQFWGVMGVTISTSISVSVCALLNVFSAKQRNNYLSMVLVKKYLLSWSIGCIGCIFVSLAMHRIFTGIGSFLRLILVTLVSLTFYFLVNFRCMKPFFDSLVRTRCKRTKK